MLKSKTGHPAPPLYGSPAWVELSTRVEQLAQRREVLTLKAALRKNAEKDLSQARSSGLAKAHVMFSEKSSLARKRNEHFIGSLELAKENFRVIHNTAGGNENLHNATVAYLAEVDRLYPAFQEAYSHAALQSIQTMEASRAETDRRRQLSKEAFTRSQSLYALLESRRQDLAVSQLLEHNEELERHAAREELQARAQAVDAMLLSEATTAGKEARRKVSAILQGDTKEELKAVQEVLRRGRGPARTDEGEGGEGHFTGSSDDVVGRRGGGAETFDFKIALAEQAALDANARLHSQWLTSQLARSAAGQTAGGLGGVLPLPTVESERAYDEEIYGMAADEARGRNQAGGDGSGSPHRQLLPGGAFSSDAFLLPSDGQLVQQYLPRSPPRAPHAPSPRSSLHIGGASSPASASSVASSSLAGSTAPIVLGAGAGMSVKFSSPIATVGEPPLMLRSEDSYSFSTSAEVCRNFSLVELARVVRHISKHVDPVRLSDPAHSAGDDAIPKSKKVTALSSIVRSDSTDQALDHTFMVTLLFDILHASRAQLLPVDLLQGTSKKIAEGLPKYHKRMKGGRSELWEEIVNLLRDTASERGDSHKPFAACLAPSTAPGSEDRSSRKVQDLMTYLVSEGVVGGDNTGVGMSALDESAAAASRSFADRSFGQRSAAMRSYEEFGEEDDNEEGSAADGGRGDEESNDEPIDEFDF